MAEKQNVLTFGPWDKICAEQLARTAAVWITMLTLGVSVGDAFATGPGGGITAPNIGDPTLDILQGGGSSIIWSFSGVTGNWRLFETPGPVGPGGAIANLFNGCDYAFAGNGSRTFFSTGPFCSRLEQLPDAPAPVGPGGAIATPWAVAGQATDLIFGLRGGNTSDFWAYSISNRAWQTLPSTPAPVGDGGAMVHLGVVVVMRGTGTTDLWSYEPESRTWSVAAPLPAPVGPGGGIAQLQRLGHLYVLRGGGSQDFWTLVENEPWTALASIPEPVNAGGGLVGINYGTGCGCDALYAVVGGNSDALWQYDVGSNLWTRVATIPQFGARTIKESVLGDLIALRPRVLDKQNEHKLEQAIVYLMNSLDSTLWIDQTHIERETGQEVFQREKNAVNKLSELSKGTKHPMLGRVLQGIFEQIVRADRLLGSVAVADAIDAGVSGKKIVEAQAELTAGDAEAANGGFEQAIERYRQAWHRVVTERRLGSDPFSKHWN